jgi:hypothetical protein
MGQTSQNRLGNLALGRGPDDDPDDERNFGSAIPQDILRQQVNTGSGGWVRNDLGLLVGSRDTGGFDFD